MWTLSVSYSNALKSLEYRFLLSHRKNIFTLGDTIDNDYSAELYEVSGHEKLIQLLCENDLDGIEKWILSFSEELTQNYKNKQFIFIRIYQLLGHLLKFLCDMALEAMTWKKTLLKPINTLTLFQQVLRSSNGFLVYARQYLIKLIFQHRVVKNMFVLLLSIIYTNIIKTTPYV